MLKPTLNSGLLRNVQSYEYVETDESTEAAQRRERSFRPRLVAARYDDDTRKCVGFHVPTQQYVGTRFEQIGRRHDQQFKKLRDDNQRKHNLCIARGNMQLSRTSGNWHPITPAEIAAIKAAEEAAQISAAQNSTPPRKVRYGRK